MSSRPITPSHDAHASESFADHTLSNHALGAPVETSVLSESAPLDEDPYHPHSRPTSAGVDGSTAPEVHHSVSQSQGPSRSGTLKKKASLKRTGSLARTGSKRSSYAGSVKSVALGEKEKHGQSDEMHSVFYSPVPTSGNPTELLANRFQAWRKVLKDLIAYFRDIQKSYDGRSKALLSATNVMNSTTIPSVFLASGGLGDALHIIRDFNKQSLTEGNKAKDIETEIISQLTGLRSDLQQKIKEIKSLSGDFKSSVDKEADGTKRAVRAFQEALGTVDHDMAASSGKGDPFLVKMAVDRQVERQIDEENYLHRAYLNLESSGRELESIVVGEIQKAYNAYATILKREANEQFETAEKLREGPLAMAKDHEWDVFVQHSNQMVDPRLPLRSAKHLNYPGKEHPAAIEVRSGMLERKSKYLKNYTPGWYILSPTHLHEYKSADRIASQAPIMSLFLPEQKLGSHSDPMSSSHKFMLKGRQTGSMHRGHTWIFRAESHDTMMAWFADMKELTEKTGEQRNEFVRRTHARSLSGNSLKAASIGSSDGGMEEDEADQMPYSSEQSVRGNSLAIGAGDGTGIEGGAHALDYDHDDERSEAGWRPPQRPSPGGRFPSDVNVARGLQAPLSPSSGDSSETDRAAIAAAGALPGSGVPFTQPVESVPFQTTPTRVSKNEQAGAAVSAYPTSQAVHPNVPDHGAFDRAAQHGGDGGHEGEWLAPIAAGTGGAAIGAVAMHHHNPQHEPEPVVQEMDSTPARAQAPEPVVQTSTIANSSFTDSPTHTHAPTASSQEGTLESLSTAPTSIGQAEAPTQPSSYFGKDGMWIATHTNTDSETGQVITPQMSKVEALGMRPPAKTAKSVSTISDLHIPGEFPRTAP